MKNKVKMSHSKSKSISNNSLMTGLILITVIFSFQTYDPFNSPKQWVLMLFAAWFAGSLLVIKRKNYQIKFVNKSVSLWVLLISFLLPQLISALLSEDIVTGLIGDVQRRNGFLTYLGLVIIFMYTVKFYDSKNDQKFTTLIVGLSALMVSYGFLQYLEKDFASWNNPYNPVILTLGNPNFAAAFLGILGSLLFSFIFDKKITIQIRLSILLVFGLLIYIIYKSNSRQGLVNLFLAISLFIGLLIFKKRSNLYSYIYFSFLFLFGIFSLLGMLQKGPLQALLYKDSVSVRGYYWRAAWEMFKENPILGVGTDQYGTYFKLYREVGYVLKYGFEITSSNAHNVFLQFFATAGVITGISYLVLVFLIFWISIRRILQDRSNIDPFFLGLFSAWVAFQLQSIVSIDNIALSIWGWVLGGMLLSKSARIEQDIHLPKNTKSIQVLISAAILLPVIVFVSKLYVSETSTLRVVSISQSGGSVQSNQILVNQAQSVAAQRLTDGLYKQITAEKMFIAGYTNEALVVLSDLINAHPDNPLYRSSRAVMNANLKNFKDVILDRKNILKTDPWNAENAFQLALMYRNVGDFDQMQALKEFIISFVPKGEFLDKVFLGLKES